MSEESDRCIIKSTPPPNIVLADLTIFPIKQPLLGPFSGGAWYPGYGFIAKQLL